MIKCPFNKNNECTFPDCVAVEEYTYHWTVEGCMGGEEHLWKTWFRCKHYPDKIYGDVVAHSDNY